jgi:hypothetical protein
MANYSDDFSSYAVATGVPTWFTARWVTTGVTHSIVSGGADKFFRQNRSGTGRGLVTMDAVDGDSNRANSEILVRVKLNNPSGGTASAGPALRCSGAAANESGYVCYVVSNRLRITWYKGGVSNTDHRESSTLTLTDGAWYWIRFRVENTTTPIALKARIWADGSGEPGTWNVDTTETNVGGTSITAAGWSGMFAFGATTWDTDDIAVATNGDTATMSGGGSVSGSGANTIGAFTQVAEGTVSGAGGITGSGANTLGTFAQTATGTVTSPSLTVGPFKNKSNAVLASTAVAHVVVLRRSDRVVVLSLSGQTTNGAGMLVISDAALVVGTEYMVASWSTDGLVAGNARFTAA